MLRKCWNKLCNVYSLAIWPSLKSQFDFTYDNWLIRIVHYIQIDKSLKSIGVRFIWLTNEVFGITMAVVIFPASSIEIFWLVWTAVVSTGIWIDLFTIAADADDVGKITRSVVGLIEIDCIIDATSIPFAFSRLAATLRGVPFPVDSALFDSRGINWKKNHRL